MVTNKRSDWEKWSGLTEANRHLNLGKAQFSHLRRWSGGADTKFDEW
jgi:hypothetical protein